jgi:hypothetical protein
MVHCQAILHGEVAMGKIIEYYVPNRFIAPRARWVPPAERGKVLDFHCALVSETEAQLSPMALDYTRVAVAPPR